MKKYLTELINSNLFFLSLVAFVAVLPLSIALVSVVGGVVLLVAIIEDNWKTKWERIKARKLILLVPLIFLIYLLSSLLTLKQDNSFYDVQKVLFYLVFPLAFSMGKNINQCQKRFVFYTFSVSILVAILVAIFRWKFIIAESGNFSVHNISLISHIRFSFQLILAIWFWGLFLITNVKSLSLQKRTLIVLLMLAFLGYLMFQQSLTGIIAFASSILFFLLYQFPKIKLEWRVPVVVVLLLMVFVPIIYLNKVVDNFYDIEIVDQENIDMMTAHGNPYSHDFSQKLVENGHYVYLYVCKDEMRTEWNKVSEFKYDSIGINGYPVSATLIRYLTSKGLRKDAQGVQALTRADIANIESGMANVIFQKKYSLYPRIYQTIWEYYVYSHTGYSNNQSFSQRIEFAKAAITIIKENWLLGVGTGKWKTAFSNAFKENHAKLDESHYASSHNQYLNYMVKFGVFGFLFIMFALIYPVVKTKRYRDLLFMIFLAFMFFANFADSNLESHMGSSFFFFFYCVFLIGPIDYLSLSEKPGLAQH